MPTPPRCLPALLSMHAFYATLRAENLCGHLAQDSASDSKIDGPQRDPESPGFLSDHGDSHGLYDGNTLPLVSLTRFLSFRSPQVRRHHSQSKS